MSTIRFSASDGKGGVASVDVVVNLCDCSGHGECQFDQLAEGYELKQSFRIVQCNCSTGWEGELECKIAYCDNTCITNLSKTYTVCVRSIVVIARSRMRRVCERTIH